MNKDNRSIEDENEVDELKNIPSEEKTKSGYLKDGFVVDDKNSISNDSKEDSDTIESDYDTDEDEDEDEDISEQEYILSDDEF